MIKTDRQALLTRLAALERQGIFWDCDVSAARSDLELLERHTPPEEPLERTADLYETLFLDEKERHRAVDPTGPARRALETIHSCLEPGEDRNRALEAYRKLWSHSLEHGLYETPGEPVDFTARKRFELIDEHMLEGDDRVHCVQQYLADPRNFANLKQQELRKRQLEEKELARSWQRLQQPTSGAGLARQEEYLIVGGARVPCKPHGPVESA